MYFDLPQERVEVKMKTSGKFLPTKELQNYSLDHWEVKSSHVLILDPISWFSDNKG